MQALLPAVDQASRLRLSAIFSTGRHLMPAGAGQQRLGAPWACCASSSFSASSAGLQHQDGDNVEPRHQADADVARPQARSLVRTQPYSADAIKATRSAKISASERRLRVR